MGNAQVRERSLRTGREVHRRLLRGGAAPRQGHLGGAPERARREGVRGKQETRPVGRRAGESHEAIRPYQVRQPELGI